MSRECNQNTQISVILKKLRNGKTLTEQANDLNVNLTLLSHIANGRKAVSKNLLNTMINFYNLTEKDVEEIKYAGVTSKQIAEAKNILDSNYNSNQLAVFLHFER